MAGQALGPDGTADRAVGPYRETLAGGESAASPSASAMVIIAYPAGHSGSFSSRKITAGKYSW